jgi:small multidrug resistance family-3 protein
VRKALLGQPSMHRWRGKAVRLKTETISSMEFFKTLALFVATALAEIVGCYLPYLWLKQDKSAWLLLPAAASLALFAWLLTLHPAAAGRVYAAYGGVYISVAMVWLVVVDKVRPSSTDWVGVAVSLLGMAIIMFGPRSTNA